MQKSIFFLSLLVFLLLFTASETLSADNSALKDGFASASIVSADARHIQLEFDIPSTTGIPDRFSKSEYHPDMSFSRINGSLVPILTYWIVVPSGSTVKPLAIGQSGVDIESAAIALNPGREAEITSISEDISVSHPAVVVGRTLEMRGVGLAPVTVYPIQVDVNGDPVFENRNLTVDLEFSGGSFASGAIEGSNSFSRALSSVVINPRQAGKPRRDLADTQLARMLIAYPEAVDDDDVLEAINEFANWKRRMGYMVDVEALDIESMDPDDIKDEIEDYYLADPPLEYLVIVGNENEEELAEYEEFDEELYFPASEFEVETEDGPVTVRSDHLYSTFRGDEWEGLLPDIVIGRMKTPSYDRLIGVIRKTIEYEQNPWLEDDAWFTQSLVTLESDTIHWVPDSAHTDSSLSVTPGDRMALNLWQNEKLLDAGYTDVINLWGNDYNDGMRERVFAGFQSGASIAFADGWFVGTVGFVLEEGMEKWQNHARTGRVNPFCIGNLNHYGSPMIYPFYASGSSDDINGAIGGMGLEGPLPYSPLIQEITASAIMSIWQNDIHNVGTLQIITKLAALAHGILVSPDMGEDDEIRWRDFLYPYLSHTTYGDPVLDIYSAAPIQLTASHLEEYNAGATSVEVSLTDPDDNPVADATVCIRQVDGIHYVMESNAAGVASFTVPEGLEAGELQITAYKHNYIPYIEDVDVTEPGILLVVESWQIEDEDEDGRLHNGEVANLVITLHNNGESAATDVTATVSFDSPHIAADPQQVSFADIGGGESASNEDELEVTLNVNCPGTTLIRVQLDIECEDQATQAAFELTTWGPNFHTEDEMIEVADSFIPGGGESAFSPQISNVGNLSSGEISANLVSLNELVTVSRADVTYDGLDPDETDGPNQSFQVAIDPLFIAGHAAEFELNLVAADGFDTTLTISKIVPNPEWSQPLGPDDYGYICFDSNDENWVEAPVYNWREINWDDPLYEVRGTKVDLYTGTDGWDRVSRIPLPEGFVYYGQEFDSLTVSSNGWAAFGLVDTLNFTHLNQPIPGSSFNSELDELFETYEPDERPVPGAVSLNGMMCINWQDIVIRSDNFEGVYYHHFEDEGLFVIEWSNLQVIDYNDDHEQEDVPMSFQIVLRHPEAYPTPTGDSEIIFQYKEFASVPGIHGDHMYSTIGITNLDGSDGIQYAYWGEYANQAHPIEDGFAIKFAPVLLNEYGTAAGKVVRFENQETGIPNAVIEHPYFQENGTTDEGGNIILPSLRAMLYEGVTVSAPGFNSVTVDVEVQPNGESDLGNIALTHPDRSVSTRPGSLENLSLRPDGSVINAVFDIENTGNGPLEYEARITEANGNDPEITLDRTIPLTPIINNSSKINGGVVVGDSIFFAVKDGGNFRTHTVAVVNLDFELVRTFDQPVADNLSDNGMYNLAWDGELLWGGVKNDDENLNLIIGFDLQGNEHIRLDNPFNKYEKFAIVFNPVDSTLFISDVDEGVFEIDKEGNILSEFSLHRPSEEVKVNGLGWNSYDVDGMNLYILEKYEPEGEPTPRILKMNPATGEWRHLGDLVTNADLQALRGLAIIHNLTPERSHIAITGDSGGASSDSLKIYDLGPNLTFLPEDGLTDRIGIVEPNATGRVGLLMDVTDWVDETILSFGVTITDNTGGETLVYPVMLTVDVDSDLDNDNNALPVEFGLQSVYPNPFNASVRVQFAVTDALPTSLKLFDISGRQVATLFEGAPSVGNHNLVWNASGVSSGVYFFRLESAGRLSTMKAVMVK